MSARRPGIDLLKLVAIVAVVLQHALAWYVGETGAASVALRFLSGATFFAAPTFFAISGYLAVGSVERRGAGAFARGRLTRIVPPYLVWSAIYLAVGVAAAAAAGRPLLSTSWFDVIFLGGAYGTLWFLPMLLYVSLLAVLPLARGHAWALLGVAAAIAAAAGLARFLGVIDAASPTAVGFIADIPWCLALFAAGAVLAERQPDPGAWAAIVALLAALATGALRAGVPDASWSRAVPAMQLLITATAVAGLAAAASSRVTFRERPWMATDYVLGIYLMHPLFMRGVGRVLPAASYPAWLWVPVAGIATLALSAAAYAVLARIPGVRRVLL